MMVREQERGWLTLSEKDGEKGSLRETKTHNSGAVYSVSYITSHIIELFAMALRVRRQIQNSKCQSMYFVICPSISSPLPTISLLGRNKRMTKRSRNPKTKGCNYQNQILLCMALKSHLSESHPRKHGFEMQFWIRLEITSILARYLDQESEAGFHQDSFMKLTRGAAIISIIPMDITSPIDSIIPGAVELISPYPPQHSKEKTRSPSDIMSDLPIVSNTRTISIASERVICPGIEFSDDRAVKVRICAAVDGAIAAFDIAIHIGRS
jgi:hypothetical protein